MFLVGIAGGSGSGKTTFAKKVMSHVDSPNLILLHMDSYYLPSQPEDNLTKSGSPNFDHPRAFDWDLLRVHLSELKKGNPIECPVYNFKGSYRTQEVVKIDPSSVIIFEGIFSLFDKEILDMLDIKCFLSVDSDIRFIRRLHRDVKERGRSLESIITQYYDSVRPMYEKYLAPQKQHADFIIGEETDSAAKILSSRIKEVLGQINLTHKSRPSDQESPLQY